MPPSFFIPREVNEGGITQRLRFEVWVGGIFSGCSATEVQAHTPLAHKQNSL